MTGRRDRAGSGHSSRAPLLELGIAPLPHAPSAGVVVYQDEITYVTCFVSYFVSLRDIVLGMSNEPVVQESEQRTCRFPGCSRPPAEPEPGATGRPPEYCTDPAHTKGAAWRARERQRKDAGPVVETRPVDAARRRAGEITGQLTGMAELLADQLAVVLEQLRTLTDPDAAAAQIEAVTTETAEQVAAANARASRAEAATRQAELDRAEADDAADEATTRAVELEAALAAADAERAAAVEHSANLETELMTTQEQAAQAHQEASEQLEQLRDTVRTVQDRATTAEQQRDAATSKAQSADRAQAAAEQRATDAETRTATEEDRRTQAETLAGTLREQLDTTREQLQAAREATGEARSALAVATAERDAARQDVQREQAHAEQRVVDLRGAYDAQLAQLRDELSQVRTETSAETARLADLLTKATGQARRKAQ